MRGRTLSNAVVILDEAQNTTSMQMKMFLTRLGENSRMIVTGDPSQIDLPPGQTSGLAEAIRLLADVEGVGHVAFTEDDVVRHELVARIVEAYDNAAAQPARGAANEPPRSSRSPLIDVDRRDRRVGRGAAAPKPRCARALARGRDRDRRGLQGRASSRCC